MKPRALDLCSKAGGATKGLQLAGFHVTGVDIEPQKNYCGDAFILGDALSVDLTGYDFVWASPDCQGYTALRHAPGAVGKPRLISAFRARLAKAGIPYAIENVEQARWDMQSPVTLCGTMFGLGAQGHDLHRHRLFETNFGLVAPCACKHSDRPVIGVYGGHARRRSAKHGGRGTKDVWEGGHKAAASEALGIDWMTMDELSNAIPPAYAEYIGRQAIAHIQAQRRAA